MPKIKTHKGAQARLKVTGSGRVMRRKVGRSHLRRSKSAQVKRQYKKMMPLDPTQEGRMQVLLPYR